MMIRKRKTKYTTDYFIERATRVHGDKYDYSETVYVRMHTALAIICRTHGKFYQHPTRHLKGSGCPICGIEKRRVALEERMRVSVTSGDATKIFIEKARKIHGDKYEYSNVSYVRSYIKVDINCTTHGVFAQTPNIHLTGSGCPTCGVENRIMSCINAVARRKRMHAKNDQ